MLMLWCTKILRPPPGRIGQLSKNIKLPRPVAAYPFYGGITGGFSMMMISMVFSNLMVTLAMTVIGALLGAWIVGVKPWKGENILKVLWIKTAAMTRTARNICPGSAMPVSVDRAGVEFCGTCMLVCEIDEFAGLRVTKQHEWKRAVYIGIQRVTPFSGIVNYRPGSVEIAR